MLSDMLPFLHTLKDYTVSLTEKSSSSVSLCSSTPFIYSVDEKKECSAWILSLLTLFHYFFVFLCISQCVWISFTLPVKLLLKSRCDFQVRCTFFRYFFPFRKGEMKVSVPLNKGTLRAHGPSKCQGCMFISFYWKILMYQSVSDTKRSKNQKHKFTSISLYNILRSVNGQNYRSE